MRGASEKAAAEIWNICNEDTDRVIQRGTLSRNVAWSLAGWREACSLVAFECYDGTQVKIPILDLQKGLSKACKESLHMQAFLRKALEASGSLRRIFYADECTAGNVLAQDKARKASLYHISWIEGWHYLKKQSAWLPVCVIQAQCLASIRGRASKVMLEIIKRLLLPSFEHGFDLPGNIRFRQLRQAHFMGDHDAVRSIFSFKGSAGLRPCTLCENVVQTGSGIMELDDHFLGIGSWSGFLPNNDENIFADCERLRTTRSKSERESLEKCSGITFDSETLMFDANHRWQMPPSKIVYDYMHTYLVNGVASWELALFVSALSSHTSVSLEDLRLTVLDDAWRSSKSSHRTPGYQRNLFAFETFHGRPLQGTSPSNGGPAAAFAVLCGDGRAANWSVTASVCTFLHRSL